MMIFEGEQGRNKSQALEILATRPDWFADHLPLGVDPQGGDQGEIQRVMGC